ncbi:DNA mismatch repair protein [Candidatus Saccharibacteria bacterium RIFCSPHIGHO2_02_FULL_47_12]|nr:MAG: DNA mismatch repair protein [Candidatus Saccharibacteria bacterium RIFCSPHIGHO2_02_FULL_47_12]
MNNEDRFSFAISLSVLNHLGRNLYRSFATVLGEAISNAWDADAKNVWIYIDRDNSAMMVKDDGLGMTREDFQDKFLKIGYSKRRNGNSTSPAGRPYIGRKGIGKLAMLSCADKVAVISKTSGSEYVGGVIDNSGLDEAIDDDLVPSDYSLETVDLSKFSDHTQNHEQGTIIYFDNLKDGIRNTVDHLKKIIALYFRFSLIDDDFNIYVDDELVTIDCLQDLIGKTQFLWELNAIEDPFITKIKAAFTDEKNEQKTLDIDSRVKGFIASTEKPSDLKIMGTGEKVTVDLFVNGRLRERDILKHIPSARVVESYVYGQIHFDTLDDGTDNDRFTSSRESVVANDTLFQELLDIIQSPVMSTIIKDWDVWRRKHKKDGDSEDTSITPKERKSGELYNAVAAQYEAGAGASDQAKKVDGWVNDLSDDASFSFGSFAECYIAENLVRKYITDKSITLTQPANDEVTKWRTTETTSKTSGNINIDIRKDDNDLNYLDMMTLAKVVDNSSGVNNMPNDAKQYKPMRDALMHTSLLSSEAKTKLTSVFDNIKARVKNLLSNP